MQAVYVLPYVVSFSPTVDAATLLQASCYRPTAQVSISSLVILLNGACFFSLLEYNPAQRLTAEEALSHPYIQEIHSNGGGGAGGLTSADCTPLMIPSEEFAFEEREITLDSLRSEILQEGR